MLLAQKPPMGWNSWNTFGPNINEKLILETADAMVELGYKDAGYEYLVVDDGWMLPERGSKGELVADPEKFPHGMKYIGDYIHKKGLKFGIYSATGVRTCLGLPGSYGHEFEDAQMFADWGVDYLKYDLCHYPGSGNQKVSYLTMGQALRLTKRPILYAGCNVGEINPGTWMKSVGAHMYRSTGDIQDNTDSFRYILESQMDNFSMSGPGCYNDIDMLVIGMYGKGNVARGEKPGCTDEEYLMHFALWCMYGAPLMIGGDVRNMSPFCRELLQNKELLAIHQDPECRPPYFEKNARYANTERIPLVKLLADGDCILGYFNFAPYDFRVDLYFTDSGLPNYSGCGYELTDVMTGENLGVKYDFFCPVLPSHTCKLYRAKMVKRP